MGMCPASREGFPGIRLGTNLPALLLQHQTHPSPRKGFKLVILDEADAMTQDAQNALRRGEEHWESHTVCNPHPARCRVGIRTRQQPRTLLPSLLFAVIEKFTENTRFCLICNYLSKIIPALQSRCTRFRFGPLTPELMVPRLQHVIQEEGSVGDPSVPTPCQGGAAGWIPTVPLPRVLFFRVDVSEDGMKALVTLSNGDMRRALNILQVGVWPSAPGQRSWRGLFILPVPSSSSEHLHGLWEGDRGERLHLHGASPQV